MKKRSPTHEVPPYKLPRWRRVTPFPAPNHYYINESQTLTRRPPAYTIASSRPSTPATPSRAYNRVSVAKILQKEQRGQRGPTIISNLSRRTKSSYAGTINWSERAELCDSTKDLACHADVVLSSGSLLSKKYGWNAEDTESDLTSLTGVPIMIPPMSEAQAFAMIEKGARERTMASSYIAMVATLKKHRHSEYV